MEHFETLRTGPALRPYKANGGTRVTHVSDKSVENYVLSRLSDEEVKALEEHLLVCECCLIKVETEVYFVELFRICSDPIPENVPMSGRFTKKIKPFRMKQ
jgi:hypothetical protein